VFEISGIQLDDCRVEATTVEPLKMPDRVASTSAARLPFYGIALIYLILPNLPLLLSAGWLGVWPHGYISLEFILIGALGLFLPRKVAFALLCIDSLADFIYAICYAYQFSLGNLLSSLRYLSVLPRGRVAEGLALLPVVLLVCAALSLVRPLPRLRVRTACGLLAAVVFLLPLDILSGQNPIWHRGDVALVSFRVLRGPLLSLVVREI
jgi:hypothetical protein